MLTPFVLAAMLAAAGPQPDVTSRFCDALATGRIRAFEPLATDANALAQPEWERVRELLAEYESIDVTRCESSGALMTIDATGVTRNAFHRREPLPRTWRLTLDAAGRSIASVDDETSLAARRVIPGTNAPDVARYLADHASEEMSDEALALIGEGDPVAASYALCALARAASPGNAPSLYAMAIDEAMRADDRDALAYARYWWAQAATDPAEKLTLLRAAAESPELLRRPRLALLAIYDRAWIESETSFGETFRLADQIEELSRRFAFEEGMLKARYLRGQIAFTVGDQALALRIGEPLPAAAHALALARIEQLSWTLIGLAHSGDPQNSADAFQRSFAVVPQDPGIGVYAHAWMGIQYLEMHRVADADKEFVASLALSNQTGLHRLYALTLGELVRRDQGRYAEAIAMAREAIAQDPHSLHMVWAVESDLGAMLVECGDIDEGIEHLRISVDKIEARRALTTASPYVRARHFAKRATSYRRLLAALVDARRYDEALEMAELLKARSIEDAHFGPGGQVSLTASEAALQRALDGRVEDLNRARIGGRNTDETRQQLRAARAAVSDFATQTAIRHSDDVASGFTPQTASMAVETGTTIEYAMFDERLFAFVIDRGRVTARELPTPASTVEKTAERFLSQIEQRDLRYATRARALYDQLIAPIADLLPKRHALTLVPDGFLWNVPFDALLTPAHRFLIEERALSYAPSVTMLAESRHRPRRAAKRTLLAIGDPRISASTRRQAEVHRGLSLDALPDAAAEARAISSLYGRNSSKVLTHAAAREADIKRLASHYRILHFATHGIIENESPLYSALVLARAPSDADDGLLEMREVRDLGLDADLVILSACDTARGALYPGEGVVGLSWAFLASGCPTAVVSQWKVESRSTSRLMIDFHRHLVRGLSPPAALRAAKRVLMRQRRYRHPMYWAPFIVVGSGG